MAVALRGSITTATATATSVAVNKPTGVVSGDVIVIWVTSINGGAACTGFSSATETVLRDYEDLFWRVADGTEGSTFTVTVGGASGVIAVCAAFSGAAGGATPFDPNNPANAASVNGANNPISLAGFENSSSEATVSDGDMMLWLVDVPNGVTITYPSGFTGTSASLAAFSGQAGLAYKVQATHGTAGTQSGSASTNGSWAAQMVAIKAAPSFIASPAAIAGQGSLPEGMSGVSNSPLVTQAVRRGSYY